MGTVHKGGPGIVREERGSMRFLGGRDAEFLADLLERAAICAV